MVDFFWLDYLFVIVFKYALFAIISTLVNIFLQYLSLGVYTDFASLYIAMMAGTLGGLVCKYILDKKYIFYHKPVNKKQDVGKFFAYSLTGVFTTALFWGTEIGFDLLFEAEFAKYIGAVIGLSIGYVAKYFLDKKYVFKKVPS